MPDGTPRLWLQPGDKVIRDDGKSFVVDERRGPRVLLKSEDDDEFFAATDAELAEMFSGARLVQAPAVARHTSAPIIIREARAGLIHVEPRHQEEAKKRLEYALALRDTPRGRRSGAALDKCIALTAARRGDESPPSSRVVRLWLKRLIDSGEDPRALVPLHAVPRRRARRLDPYTIEIIESAIDRFYLRPERWSCSIVYDHMLKLHRDYIEKHPELRTKMHKPPSIAALRRAIQARDPYLVMMHRWGKQAADRHFRIVRRGRQYSRPLEAVLVDATRLDLFVKDEEAALVRETTGKHGDGRAATRSPAKHPADDTIGRPWLIVVLDAYTRMIVGFALTMEAPSEATVLQALRNAMAPKTYVKTLYPYIQQAWPCYGRPEEVIADVGPENLNRSIPRALHELFADVTYTAAGQPQQKGAVERFFATLNAHLIHMLPGTSRSSPTDLRRGNPNYDPTKHVKYTLSDMRAKLHRYFIEVYPNKLHRELGCTPLQRWEEGVKLHPVRPPPPDSQLAILLSSTTERNLQHYGINLWGLLYRSKELSDLRPATMGGRNLKVTVKYDPNDISRVWILNKALREYVTAYADHERLAFGLSLRQWRAIQAEGRRRGKKTTDDLYELRCEMFADIANGMRVKRPVERPASIKRSPTMLFGAGDIVHQTGMSHGDFLDQEPDEHEIIDPDAPVHPIPSAQPDARRDSTPEPTRIGEDIHPKVPQDAVGPRRKRQPTNGGSPSSEVGSDPAEGRRDRGPSEPFQPGELAGAPDQTGSVRKQKGRRKAGLWQRLKDPS